MAEKTKATVTATVAADGKSFRELKKEADGLHQALGSIVQEATKLKKGAINFAAISVGISQAQGAINGLSATINDLTGAYSIQAEAETKLQTVMRERMAASAADIQAIKDLASAQQSLGVIGDEVQLAGAQQLATFLSQKEALAQLIPAMNDLVAQQKGLNATQGDCVTVANMMGKAMQGNVTALQRVGIVMSEEQKEMLKNGDEMQRSATLAQIITDNVGHMNAELAKTDAGRAKQLANSMGDLKEMMGKAVQGIAPYITAVAGIVNTTANFSKATAAVGALSRALGVTTLATKAADAAIKSMGLSARAASVGVRILSGTIKTMLITSVVGAGIWLLGEALNFLISACSGAEEALDQEAAAAKAAAEEHERWVESLTDLSEKTGEYSAKEIKKLDELYRKATTDTKARKERLKAVQELKATWPEYFGQLSAETIMLGKQAAAYDNCREAILRYAKAKAAQDKITDNYSKLIDLEIQGEKLYDTSKNASIAQLSAAQEYHDALDNFKEAKSDWEFYGSSHATTEADRKKYKQRYKSAEERLAKASANLDSANAATITAQEAWQQNQTNQAETKNAINKLVPYADGTPKNPTVNTSAITPTASVGSTAQNTEKTRAEEIREEVRKLQEAYITADETKRKTIRQTIAALNEELATIENAQAEALTVAGSLAELEQQRSQAQARYRNAATDEERLKAQKDLLALEQKQREITEAANPIVAVGDLKTMEEAQTAVARINEQLERAPKEQRVELLKLLQLYEKWIEAQELADMDARKPAELDKITTLKELGDTIAWLEQKRLYASGAELEAIDKELAAARRKYDAYNRLADIYEELTEMQRKDSLTGRSRRRALGSMGFDDLTAQIEDREQQLANAPTPAAAQALRQQIAILKKWRKECVLSWKTAQEGWDAIKGLAGGVSSLSRAFSENADVWTRITSGVDGIIAVAEAISSIISLIQMFTTVQETASAASAVASAIEAGAAQTEADAFLKLAGAKTLAAHADIPFAGFGIAAGIIGGMAPLLSGLTAFANGGLVYGATRALVGEYPGARNNPEVIAPLSKLKKELGGNGGATVRFVIKGQNLVGVISNTTRIGAKSGRKTKIIL